MSKKILWTGAFVAMIAVSFIAGKYYRSDEATRGFV